MGEAFIVIPSNEAENAPLYISVQLLLSICKVPPGQAHLPPPRVYHCRKGWLGCCACQETRYGPTDEERLLRGGSARSHLEVIEAPVIVTRRSLFSSYGKMKLSGEADGFVAEH